MIASLRLPCLAAILLVLAIAGCGDTVEPGSSIYTPSGRWRYTETDTLLGTTLRSGLAFNPLTRNGTIVDTFSRAQGGADSIVSYRFQYGTVGEGYQRIVMIREDSIASPDTSLAYWYFYRRGDTLLYYSGMRFVGNSPLLQGVWENDPGDVATLGEHCRLEFSDDSVKIVHAEQGSGSTTRTLVYQTSGNLLQVAPDSCIAGDRFEINPGISLYITSRLSRRYLPQR